MGVDFFTTSIQYISRARSFKDCVPIAVQHGKAGQFLMFCTLVMLNDQPQLKKNNLSLVTSYLSDREQRVKLYMLTCQLL